MDLRHLFSIAVVIIGLIIYFVLKYKFFQNREYTSQYKDVILLEKDDNLLNKVIDSMKLSNFNDVVYDEKTNKFYASTLATMSSWSEFIEVEMEKIDDTNILLKFLSRCTYPYQVFDWGKNKKNFEKFEAELNKVIA